MTDRPTHSKIDTAALLAKVNIVNVIERYVPDLRKSGAEYEACCPFHTEDTPSFKVTPSKGFYHCFGCGAHGDAIAFLMEHQSMSFHDAVAALGGDTLPVPQAGQAQTARQPVRGSEGEESACPWVPILPVPEGAGDPPKAHIKRGLPEQSWCYRNAESKALGYVCRFKTSDGGKETLPLVYARHEKTGATEWRWMAFPEPRPLYGLDRLAAKSDATVLLVEGEKCADVAAALLPEFAVVSWPGGCKAVKKADWSVLAGRKVIAWPDADAKRVPLTKTEKDALPSKEAQAAAQAAKPLLPEVEQPGIKAMEQAAGAILRHGGRVRTVKIPPPGEKPDGWDVADAITDGMDADALRTFIGRLRMPVIAAQAAEGIHTPELAGAGPEDWRRQLLRKDDRLIDCRENVYLILRYHRIWLGTIWLDDFARRIVKRRPAPWDHATGFVPGTEWAHEDDLRLGLWLAQQERLLIRSQENLASAVAWVASESRFHPVRDYLESLVWDKVPRISEWLTDYLGVKKTEYAVLCGRLFMIGMVSRIYQPGCQMRFMPILEGVQFRGKSSALRILGGEWFGDTQLDLNNKDTYQLIQGCWLYEIGELDAFNRTESTRVKAFVSSQVDRFRAPYERAPRDWPRQTVFVGTTNQDEYFKDTTGNTRYWPLRVEEDEPINLDGLTAARDQLFAEAVILYKRGERWHPTREEQQRLFEPEQADREIADPWQALIARWLREGTTSPSVTAETIMVDCLKIEPSKIDSNRQMSTRVGIAMKRLGWVKRRQTSGSREYYYERPAGCIPAGHGVGAQGDDHVPL